MVSYEDVKKEKINVIAFLIAHLEFRNLDIDKNKIILDFFRNIYNKWI